MMTMFLKFVEVIQGLTMSLNGHQEYSNIVTNKSIFTQNVLVLLNYGGMLYVICFTTLLHWVASSICLPAIFHLELQDPDFSGLFYRRLFFWYLTVNGVGNYILIMYGGVKSIYCSAKDLPLFNDATHSDWTKCTKCDQNVPPRTRHCNICDRCVLKRDHHCFFSGCCIGFHNQRHFILFCFHGIVSTIVALYYLEQYLTISYVSFLGPEFFKYFLPYAVVMVIVGKSSFYTFLAIFWFYISFTTCLMCFYFFCWQINLIINGQTSYEFVKGKKNYQTSFSEHMLSVFGPWWILQFFLPIPFLRPVGDGMTWRAHNTKFL